MVSQPRRLNFEQSSLITEPRIMYSI